MPQHTIATASAADAAEIAALVARAPSGELCDYEHAGPADLLAFDTLLEGAGSRPLRLVARGPGGELIGAALAFEVPWGPRAGRCWCSVRVDPPARRRGVGGELLRRCAEELRARGGRTMAAEVRAASADLIPALGRAGMREAFRSVEFRLDPRDTPAAELRAASERARAQGVRVVALPELAEADPGWLATLHALYSAVIPEVPIPERPLLSPYQLAAYLREGPAAMPEACFLAVDGGRLVGLSFMQRGDGLLLQKLTGVAPGERGRGLALTLKAATIEHALAASAPPISTWVETNNPPMLALNARLGFRQADDWLAVLELPL